MQILVKATDPQTRNVDEERVRSEVHAALSRFAERVTRVEVHVRDLNGPKAGNDKQCTIEARLAGMDPIAVTAEASDLAGAVISAAGKIQRKVQNEIDRRTPRRA